MSEQIKADARRDVLAYLRALNSRNSADAVIVAEAALQGEYPGEFVWQLSTFALSAIHALSATVGLSSDEVLTKIQQAELAHQAGGTS